MNRHLVMCLVVATGCNATDKPPQSKQGLFDCGDPAQRLSCPAPTDPARRFVCHATPNKYVKISVPLDSPQHMPGVADANGRVDQAPGASANDLDAATGLDCDCAPRVCVGECTGAAVGTACDDGDPCTVDGTCSGDACIPGAPSCNAGVPVDSCHVQNGACDADTGECLVDVLPGTVCEGGGVPHVVINEVESSGGVPGDWIELYNDGTGDADVSGWRILDNDDSHTAYVIPSGTTIAAGGYRVFDEAQFGFGLGAADSARLFDTTNTLVDSYAWTTHAVTTYGRCGGVFKTTTSVTKGGANDCSVAVRINEVESSGGVPGDWVELYNAGPTTADMSGWIFRDNDDNHGYAFPAGTTIAPGGYYMLEEAAFGFGLGAADAARIFDASGAPIDAYSWTSHAAITYGRCPDGTGAFTTTASPTKAATNACGTSTSTGIAWPGRNAVTTFGDLGVPNISGLFFDGSTLWAVQNNPGALFEVSTTGAVLASRTLVYPDGTGVPDSEDVTKAELSSPAIYVATERDNAVGSVNRFSILRYDTSAAGTTLVATHEWNVTADLPAMGTNLGLEAITWIPDSVLVAAGFLDAHAGHAYNPAEYANHGTGLFFVGLESNGMIYVYALDHVGGGYTRIASFASGDVTVKSLYYDRDVGYLWSYCGTACGNQASIFTLAAGGAFALAKQVARPSTMPNLQNEGIAFAPESQCVAGQKTFWWADDSATDAHSLRTDTVACGAF